MDPLNPRGAPQRPLLLTILPRVTPRSAHRGITLPLRGITPRRGDWPGSPTPSWLQGWLSSSLLRYRGAAPKRGTLFSGSSLKSEITFFERCNTFHSGPAPVKTFKKTKTVAIRVGDGRTIDSLGGVDVTICLGDENVTEHCRVLDTDAFDIVIGTDFLRRNPQVKMLSLQRPYSLHCDFGSGLFSVPLELLGRKEYRLRYASKTNYRTENYQLARRVLENGLAALQVNLDGIQVELSASQQQHIMQLYCSKHLNNAFRFFWQAMGLAYANPPFSLLAKVLTKITYQGGRVFMCTPDPGCSGEHAYWRRMPDRMTLGRVQLPDDSIYVPEDSDTAMQAPDWASILSIVDGSVNPVPLCDLDQVLLKEVMAKNRGLTLSDLKNRSPEHLSATLTGCESSDGYLEPAGVRKDADDQLSEIASTIPPVDPSCVDLKHSAFLAQLLLEEVYLDSTSEPTSPVGKLVLQMQPMHTAEPVGWSPDALARPASNNMPLSEHDTQEL